MKSRNNIERILSKFIKVLFHKVKPPLGSRDHKIFNKTSCIQSQGQYGTKMKRHNAECLPTMQKSSPNDAVVKR